MTSLLVNTNLGEVAEVLNIFFLLSIYFGQYFEALSKNVLSVT